MLFSLTFPRKLAVYALAFLMNVCCVFTINCLFLIAKLQNFDWFYSISTIAWLFNAEFNLFFISLFPSQELMIITCTKIIAPSNYSLY